MTGLKSRTISGIAWMSLASIARLASKVVFFVILARLISPKDYGVFGSAFTIVQFATLVSELGVSQSIIQKKEVSEEEISSGHYFCLTLGFLLCVVLQLAAPWASTFFADESVGLVLRVLAVVFIIRSASSIAEAMLTREMRFKLIATRETAIYVAANLTVGIPLAWLGWNVWALVWSTLASELLRTIVILWAYPVSWKHGIQLKALKPLLGFGMGVSTSAIFNKIALNIDNVIVGRVLGMEALGYYSRAYQLVAMPANLFGEAAAKVLFPALSQIQDDSLKLTQVFLSITKILCWVVLPASLLIAIFCRPVILLLLGPTWAPVILPFQLLSIGMFFRVGYKIVGVLARSTARVKWLLYTQAAFALLITLGAWIGSQWGIEGVAIGVLIGLIAHYVLISWIGILITHCSAIQWAWAHWQGGALFLLFASLYMISTWLLVN